MPRDTIMDVNRMRKHIQNSVCMRKHIYKTAVVGNISTICQYLYPFIQRFLFSSKSEYLWTKAICCQHDSKMYFCPILPGL